MLPRPLCASPAGRPQERRSSSRDLFLICSQRSAPKKGLQNFIIPILILSPRSSDKSRDGFRTRAQSQFSGRGHRPSRRSGTLLPAARGESRGQVDPRPDLPRGPQREGKFAGRRLRGAGYLHAQVRNPPAPMQDGRIRRHADDDLAAARVQRSSRALHRSAARGLQRLGAERRDHPAHRELHARGRARRSFPE